MRTNQEAVSYIKEICIYHIHLSINFSQKKKEIIRNVVDNDNSPHVV
ncbi:hypothetical protein HMPREF9081_2488 [Centipeda periodontii DSM 2778]|uniref:Uncharacterized protein n=1 Tax=Centipeda periodontii DSM 2778 TaxID=888060 RepID=F5RQF2_9FIRM|nr:hypothetical protein HMPREF9081_2488 [Centipeda periodontii DSM 2778]